MYLEGMSNPTILAAARGAGALACRQGRKLHRAVIESVRAIPELAGYEAAIRSGWHAERAQLVADGVIGTMVAA